jgi:DNA integrity scanning protein DisA with diadenylate cyclase activity
VTPHEFIAALSWRDALDFGFLLIIVYTVLRLLTGTRALPVLLSVAVFSGLAAAAGALDLVAVAALLKYFLEYVIIILIVVFHQELRRIFLRVGQRLLPHGRREATRSAVGELVLAIDRLRRAKVGALVILQGEIDVLEVVSDRGREINAALQADTIVALMIPHPINLTHDGALLIQNFRIARAGVICPLTQRDRLDPSFGTRHRGGIGVSEETDALVAVVSEERGEIRVVLEARIAEWLDQPPEAAAMAASVVAGSRAAVASESLVLRSLSRTRVDLRRESVRSGESLVDLSANPTVNLSVSHATPPGVEVRRVRDAVVEGER